MAAGLQARFNVLPASPHDGRHHTRSEVVHDPAAGRWMPSRYTIRASAEDGRLILWNTFRGTMSVFRPEQSEQVTALLSRQGVTARKEGLVAYLVQRGFLLREGTNEYRQVQVAIHQQQYRTDRLEYILMASEDCNFRCKYCYEEFARGTMLPEVREAIKKHAAKTMPRLKSFQVSWFGGEPLYGWEAVEDLAPFFQELAREHEVGYFSNMTTNGYLLTPEVADKLLAWDVRRFQITIDGLPENHDCSRPTRDGQPTFDTILANLRALARRPDTFSVAIRINFDRENGPHLARFLELIEKDFAHDPRFGLLFRAVGRWGGGNDANLDVCGTSEADQIKAQLAAEAKRRGFQLGDIRGVNSLGSQVCYAARPYNFLIGATGKIMKCTISLDTQDNNVVGHLKPDGTMALDRDKMALWTEPAFENDSKCQKCVVVPLCQGTHCPLIRIDEGVSPCCGTRSSAKRELQSLLEEGSLARRRVPVTAAAPLPAQTSEQPPAA